MHVENSLGLRPLRCGFTGPLMHPASPGSERRVCSARLSCVREKVEGPPGFLPSSLPGLGFLGASDVPSLQPSRLTSRALGPARASRSASFAPVTSRCRMTCPLLWSVCENVRDVLVQFPGCPELVG